MRDRFEQPPRMASTRRTGSGAYFCLFLAYVLWKTLGRMCRNAGLEDEPGKVLRELAQIKLTDLILPTRDGAGIWLRRLETPGAHRQMLLQRLQLTLPRGFEKHNL
jgi:hypothetical protein